MQFEECELDMAVQIDTDAKAGIKVWVLELGGGVKRSNANTIKLKFKALGVPESARPSDGAAAEPETIAQGDTSTSGPQHAGGGGTTSLVNRGPFFVP